ncbi:MAG: hypothetical protein BWY71_01436 [Planctomycetes bacterium ADurb.Bin412]|nr:MAG: hypothetical protein BWY71_01436 [Planctomycetes bacterium ADurb.Bin412]
MIYYGREYGQYEADAGDAAVYAFQGAVSGGGAVFPDGGFLRDVLRGRQTVFAGAGDRADLPEQGRQSDPAGGGAVSCAGWLSAQDDQGGAPGGDLRADGGCGPGQGGGQAGRGAAGDGGDADGGFAAGGAAGELPGGGVFRAAGGGERRRGRCGAGGGGAGVGGFIDGAVFRGDGGAAVCAGRTGADSAGGVPLERGGRGCPG